MAQATTTPTKPLIESDRVEGTTIYGANGERIGTVKRLMIEKVSGRVAYAVIAFGFSDLGTGDHTIPWGKLVLGASSPTTPASAATGRTSPKPTSSRRPASRLAKSTTGRIVNARSSCTTTIGSHPTGEPSSPGSAPVSGPVNRSQAHALKSSAGVFRPPVADRVQRKGVSTISSSRASHWAKSRSGVRCSKGRG
jgi:sporulation protein YlmC with PRC-barrel domain